MQMMRKPAGRVTRGGAGDGFFTVALVLVGILGRIIHRLDGNGRRDRSNSDATQRPNHAMERTPDRPGDI